MITSAGGCCDCGDPEAWSEGVYCSLHQPEENEAEEEEVGTGPGGGGSCLGGGGGGGGGGCLVGGGGIGNESLLMHMTYMSTI